MNWMGIEQVAKNSDESLLPDFFTLKIFWMMNVRALKWNCAHGETFVSNDEANEMNEYMYITLI